MLIFKFLAGFIRMVGLTLLDSGWCGCIERIGFLREMRMDDTRPRRGLRQIGSPRSPGFMGVTDIPRNLAENLALQF